MYICLPKVFKEGKTCVYQNLAIQYKSKFQFLVFCRTHMNNAVYYVKNINISSYGTLNMQCCVKPHVIMIMFYNLTIYQLILQCMMDQTDVKFCK